MLGAAPRRHVYKAVVLLVAISAAVLSSNVLGSVRAKTAVNRPQAKLWAIGVSAPHASRLSLPRVREFAADGISVIVTSPSGWSSASYRRLADLSVRSGLQLVAPRTDVRSTADRHALSRACHSRVRVPDSCAVISRNAGQARAWIHRGSVRYVVLPVSSPNAFTALRVASTPNTHVIGLIKLPTLGVRTSLPAPVAAAASSLQPSRGGGGSGGGRKRPDNKPPSVPGGLVVSSAGQTSVALTWRPSTDNVGVVGYGVYSNGTLAASSTSTGYTLTGLTCGTSHSLAVDAYDAAGNRSSRATVTTSTAACPVTQSATQPPTAPTGIALGTRTTTSISITWTASTDNLGVAGYDLYAGSSDVGTATATAYTFTNLTCGTSYTLGVDAYDAAGNHSPETTGVFSTSACPDTTPPSTPMGLVVSSAGQTSVALAWNASTDNVGVVGYGVYSNGKLVASPTSTGYVLTGLSCGTSYTVAVDAYDAAGNRSSQATVTTSTVACPDNQPPTAPAVIALATRTTTNISITWTASIDNVGVVGYDLFADRFAGGTNVGTATATAYTFTNLTCSTSYRLGVDAYDAAGNHSTETTVVLSTSACPPDTTPPSTPTGLATSGVGQTGATLSWTASSDNVGVTGYRLYRGSTQVGTVTGTTYAFGGLSCGTSYTLGVAAYDAAGNVSGTGTTLAATATCASVAGSANIFVSPSGTDTCTRSASPTDYGHASGHICGTPAKACQLAQSGDTVILEDGTYKSHMDGCAQGHQNYGQNVIFKPEPGHECPMTYPNVPAKGSDVGCAVNISGNSGDGQLGLSLGGNDDRACGVSGNPLPSTLSPSQMATWDTHLTFEGIYVGQLTAICSAHVTLDGDVGTDFFLREGVYDWTIKGSDFGNDNQANVPTIGDSLSAGGSWPPLQDVTLEGSLIHDFTSTNGDHGDGLFVQPSYNVTVAKDVFARDDCIPLYVNYAQNPQVGVHNLLVVGNVIHTGTQNNSGFGDCGQALSLGDNDQYGTLAAFNSVSTNDLGIRRSNSGSEINTGIRMVGNVADGIAASNSGNTYGCGAGTTADYNVLMEQSEAGCAADNILALPLPLTSEDTTSTANGLITTPVLGDYRLVSGSPAIAKVPASWCATDAQTQQACALIATDINGSPRPNPTHPSFYDAGAYENR